MTSALALSGFRVALGCCATSSDVPNARIQRKDDHEDTKDTNGRLCRIARIICFWFRASKYEMIWRRFPGETPMVQPVRFHGSVLRRTRVSVVVLVCRAWSLGHSKQRAPNAGKPTADKPTPGPISSSSRLRAQACLAQGRSGARSPRHGRHQRSAGRRSGLEILRQGNAIGTASPPERSSTSVAERHRYRRRSVRIV
jgi:hypothetical protein